MFNREEDNFLELRLLSTFFILVAVIIIGKLFYLQVFQHDYYRTLAMSTHEIYQKIHPKRGQIYFQDTRTGETFPAAINRYYYQIYAVPKEIDRVEINSTTEKIAEILQLDEEKKELVRAKLSKENDPFESLARKISVEVKDELMSFNLKGIYNSAEEYRYYPENDLGGSVLGFCNLDSDNNMRGNYGAEGYWNKVLSGKSGYFFGARGARGSWITLADMTTIEAKDGDNLVLTIDRALQNKACELLKNGVESYKAKSAALVMMDPQTGAVLAMCSYPDFDPNNYGKIEDVNQFNNQTIFTPYEPGSVFKPVVMSMGLDLQAVTPDTLFNDPCEMKYGPYIIRNALKKCYGTISMTGVLENSVNTGMMWLAEKIGWEKMTEYLKHYGFGEQTGVELDREVSGDLKNLEKKSQIGPAQASFGQGITVTPIQLAAAYSIMANGGKAIQPHVVQEIRRSDGQIEKKQTDELNQVISSRASRLITAMLTSVVERTYTQTVRLDHYFVAGKTGTAQIAGPRGYSETDTNHTFCGFLPAKNPKVVIVVKYEKPERLWAEGTAAITFRDLAKFTMDYYGVEEDR